MSLNRWIGIVHFLLALIFALTVASGLLLAQQITGVSPRFSVGTISATDPGTCQVNNTGCVVVISSGYNALTVQVSGVFTGLTLNFESCITACSTAANWQAVLMTPPGQAAPVTSVSSTGQWIGASPAAFFRVRSVAISTGSASVSAYATLGLAEPPIPILQSAFVSSSVNTSVNQWLNGKTAILTTLTPGNGVYVTGIGVSTGTTNGSITANSQPEAMYATATGAAVLNQYTGESACNCTGGIFTDDQNFTCDWVLITGPSIASSLYSVGLGTITNANPSNTGTFGGIATDRFMVFRYLDGTDTGWNATTWSGSTQTTTAVTSSIGASSHYRLRISHAAAAATATFQVYGVGGLLGSQTLSVPASSAKGLNVFFGVTAKTAVALAFSFSHMVCSIGGPFTNG